MSVEPLHASPSWSPAPLAGSFRLDGGLDSIVEGRRSEERMSQDGPASAEGLPGVAAQARGQVGAPAAGGAAGAPDLEAGAAAGCSEDEIPRTSSLPDLSSADRQ